MTLPRAIAIVLALGGLFWGVFLLLAFGPRAVTFPPAAVGYLVTAGYIARALNIPPLWLRRPIWVASLVVQGGWLGLALPEILRANKATDFIIPAWWALATILSAIALVTERESRGK